MRFPIRRELRLHFIGQAFGNPRRRAAGDRHGVNVAQHVEHDQLPSGLTSTSIHVPSSTLMLTVRVGRGGAATSHFGFLFLGAIGRRLGSFLGECSVAAATTPKRCANNKRYFMNPSGLRRTA
jgi:hypothetical protein